MPDLDPSALPDPASAATPWIDHFPRAVPSHYDVPAVDITRLLDDAVQDFPEADAILRGGRSWTYRQLLDLVDRLATTLSDVGAREGDRVGIVLPTGPPAVTALFAAWRLGATAVVVDHGLEPALLGTQLDAADLRVVVGDERRLATWSGGDHGRGTQMLVTGQEDVLPFPRNLVAMARRSAWGRRTPGPRMMDLLRRSRPIALREAPPGNRAAVDLVDGDGAQSFTHEQVVAAAFQLRLWLPDVVAGGERILGTLPLHTPLGLCSAVTMPVLAAATMVQGGRRDPRRLARLPLARLPLAGRLDRADPTIAILPADRLPAALEGMRAKKSSLRVVLTDGAVDGCRVAAAEERTGARVRTLCAPRGSAGVVLAEPVYGRTKPGTAGMPVTDTRVVVADPVGGRVCEPGEQGVLLVHGPQVNGVGAAGTRPSSGWWSSGCHGSMDADGFVTLAPAGATAGH